MIQTILCATDLGVFSTHVLQHVLNLARRCDARVVLVHAVEPFNLLADAVVKSYLPEEARADFDRHGMPQLINTIKDQVVMALADEFMDEDMELSRIVDIRVVQGRPADVILTEAQAIGADLIAVGSHGPEQMDSILGSTTSKILQLSKVPVYMVPMMRSPATADSRSAEQLQFW